MAQEEKWETFGDEEEEALSLSDLPVTSDDKKKSSPRKEESNEPLVAEEFEFRSFSNGGFLSKVAELDMCAADEVFYQGQILPLRPSVSSDSGLGLRSRGLSRCDSTDRHSSAVSSMGSCSGRSNSTSSRSSGCISRSHSSSSGSSDAPRLSFSNNFYAHPSPSPQLRTSRNGSAGRKSTSSPGPAVWPLFRLGVVKAPEIELHDLRARRASCGNGGGTRRPEKMVARANDGEGGAKSCRSSDGSKRGSAVEKKAARFLGLGCKCSPEAVETVPSRVLIAKKKKEEGMGLKRGDSMRHSRMFEWLEDLSITKSTVT